MGKIAWDIYTLFLFLAGRGDRLMPKPAKTRGPKIKPKRGRPKTLHYQAAQDLNGLLVLREIE